MNLSHMNKWMPWYTVPFEINCKLNTYREEEFLQLGEIVNHFDFNAIRTEISLVICEQF